MGEIIKEEEFELLLEDFLNILNKKLKIQKLNKRV
jgi:hypothetical protein